MSDTPGHPALARLGAFVGRWRLEAAVGGQVVGGEAWTEFAWGEGGAFLVQHADARTDETTPEEWVVNSPFPVTTIVGLDDSSGQYTQLYADGRSVYRVYQMTFDGTVWKAWRDAPGFYQRSTATFSADGRTITGGWEGSKDGVDWAPDFDFTYTKLDS